MTHTRRQRDTLPHMYTHNRLKGEVEETEEPRRTKQLIKEEEETHMSEVEGEKWWIKVEGGVGGGAYMSLEHSTRFSKISARTKHVLRVSRGVHLMRAGAN